MSKTKEILACILAITVLVLAITTNVFATADDLFAAYSNNQNNNVQNIENRNTQNNSAQNIQNKNTSINTKANVNKNANVSNASEHADAGVDYSIVLIIAICGISAIYAYKKIRDYNV